MQRLVHRAGLADLVTLPAQNLGDQPPLGNLVLDQQN